MSEHVLKVSTLHQHAHAHMILDAHAAGQSQCWWSINQAINLFVN